MKDISLYEKIPSQKNNYTVKFANYSSTGALLPHWHEHIELLYFFRGEGDVITDGKRYEVKGGDLIVVNSTEVHSFIARKRLEYLCILIFPEFFSDVTYDKLQIESHVRGDGTVDGYIKDICRELEGDEEGKDMMLKGYTYGLLAHLMRRHTYSVMSKREQDARESRLRRLDTVMEYISKNYTENITTKALSEMCYLSEEHFCRFFKKAMGKTATEYINEYRVEKASILLKNTDESVSRVALDVGYDDLNYFSRVFKRHLGKSPVAYRKAHFSKEKNGS